MLFLDFSWTQVPEFILIFSTVQNELVLLLYVYTDFKSPCFLVWCLIRLSSGGMPRGVGMTDNGVKVRRAPGRIGFRKTEESIPPYLRSARRR